MVELYGEKLPGDLHVTDFEFVDGRGAKQIGYRMNRLLHNNIIMIPGYLQKDNALIGIVSGSGLTRIGKSFMGFQIAYYAAWCIAGGVMDDLGNVIQKPTQPVRLKYHFDTLALSDDIANEKEDYMVYVLDEGEAGAGSKSATSKKNKDFRDLIVRSALKKYFLIMIAPDFLALSSQWACVHSDFLVNVHTIKGKRGYFNFYDRDHKTKLYYWGRKQVGDARYAVTYPSFFGTFPNVFPGDFAQYNKDKQESLLNLNQITRKKSAVHRDIAIAKALEITGLTYEEFAEKTGLSYSEINNSVFNYNLRKKLELEALKGGNPNGERTNSTANATEAEVCSVSATGEECPVRHEEERDLS